MMPTKFGCKRCRSSDDMEQTVVFEVIWNRMRPTVLLWNQQTMEMCLNTGRHTLNRHTTTDTRVTYNSSTWHAMNLRMSSWWSLCTLYSSHARWSYHRRLRSLLFCACSMCDVDYSSAITSRCLLSLRILVWAVTLTLKIGTQRFHMTLWAMTMRHHTKFGCIQFSGLEDIFQTKVWQTDRQHDSNIPPPPLTFVTGNKKSFLWTSFL